MGQNMSNETDLRQAAADYISQKNQIDKTEI